MHSEIKQQGENNKHAPKCAKMMLSHALQLILAACDSFLDFNS